MTVRELTAKLGFEVDNSQLKKFETSLASAKSNLKSLGVTVTAAAGALFGIVKTTANHGEEASKLAERLGVTTEAYQKMSFAAHMADIGTEEFNQSMSILTRTMGATRQGSKEAAGAFAGVGGKVAGLVRNGASADEVLLSISDRFKQIKDPAKKAALAQQLFGRAGQRMIPFLNKGSEEMRKAFEMAEEYGLVLDGDVIDASNRFNDGLKELVAQGVGLKNIIGSGLLKTLAPLIEELNQWVSTNKKLIAQNLTEVIQGLSDVVQVAFGTLKKIVTVVVALVKPIGGLGTAVKLLVGGFAAFKALQLVSDLGSMATAISGTITGWQALGKAGMLANLKMLAGPLLIGAALVGLFLLFEDLLGMIQGRDSFFGFIDRWFHETFPEAAAGFQKGMFAIFDAVSWVGEKIGAVFTWILDKFMALTDFFMGKSDIFNGMLSALGGIMGGGVSVENALPGGGAANQKNINSSINAPMTFNMGASEQSPDKIGSTVYNNLDDLLRSTNQSFASQVAN